MDDETGKGAGLDSFERGLKALVDGADLGAPPSPTLVGATIGGTYVVLDELGEGGMGRVLLAEHTRTGGQVALKLIKASRLADENAIRRFELEAKHTASLHHPNIVRVFDFGRDGDLVYLAMEYVPGRSLQELLVANGRLPWRTVVSITEQILKALAAAHDSERQLIHRDIKPANILLTDEDTFVKVLDFGIARALDGPAAATTQGIIGSPQTMAPEQFDGGEITPATDLYALGCTVYAMLSGRPPFDGTFGQLAMKHCNEEAPSLADLDGVDDVPVGLQRWVERLLEKDPAARPRSAAEALAELRRSLDAVPPARHMTTTSRGVAVAGAVVLLLAIIGAAVWATRATEPRDSVATPTPTDRPPASADAGVDIARLEASEIELDVIEEVPGQARSLELSPQGNFLAYRLPKTIEILTLSTRSTASIDVPEGWSVSMLSWFPDGARLLVSLQHEDKSEIWVLHMVEKRWERLITGALVGRVSGDGTQLAFLQNNALYVSDVGGRNSRTVAQFSPTALIADIRWFDAQTLIIGYVDPGKEGDELAKIVAVEIESGERAEIVSDPRLRMMRTFDVALSGNRVIYNWRSSGVFGGQLRAVEIDPVTHEAVGRPLILRDATAEQRGFFGPSASNDGRVLVAKVGFQHQNLLVDVAHSPPRFDEVTPVAARGSTWPPTITWVTSDSYLAAETWEGTRIDRWDLTGGHSRVYETTDGVLLPVAVDPSGRVIAFQLDDWQSDESRLLRFADVEMNDEPEELGVVPFPQSAATNFRRLQPGVECVQQPEPRCFLQRFLAGRIELFEITDEGLADRPLVSVPAGTHPPFVVDIGGSPTGILIVGKKAVQVFGLDGGVMRSWQPPVEFQSYVLQWGRWHVDGGFFVSAMGGSDPEALTMHVDRDGRSTVAFDESWLGLYDASPDGRHLLAYTTEPKAQFEMFQLPKN